MKLRFNLALLSMSFLCSAIFVTAQNPATTDKQRMDGVDAFQDAHQGMFTTGTDTAKDAARFTDQVSKAVPGAANPTGKIPRRNLVDEFIFGRIERDGVPHAALSSDLEFLRRVYLDATGLIPEPQVVRDFVANKDPDKRDKLIDSLIGTEKFSEQWAWFWGDLFRVTSHSGNGKDVFQYWNKEWLQLDRPYNEVVTDLLTGVSKRSAAIPSLVYLHRNARNGFKNRRSTDPDNYGTSMNRLDVLDEFAIDTGRVFLGINMECISCHDGAGHLESVDLHLSERTRDEFAEQAAFMGHTQLVASMNDRSFNFCSSDMVIDDLAKGYDTADDSPWMTASENRFPRSGKAYEPRFLLTGEVPRPGVNPRAELARMITSHPQFSRATVNLIWGKLMTVGFVEPYDHFDLARIDPKNPPPKPWTIQPTNPELMEALAEDFRSHGHSIHRLMKTIMKSNAYQLSSKWSGEWKDSYTPYYARKYVRVMTGPEVIDSIGQSTARPYKFQFSGTEFPRVKQLTDLNDAKRGREGRDVAGIMNSFFQNNREAPPPTGNKATILQAILMMSSQLVNERVLAEKGSLVQQLVDSGKSNAEIIDELYLATLSRWPTPEETAGAIQTFEFEKDRKRAAQDFHWTLLNGIEFVLNH